MTLPWSHLHRLYYCRWLDVALFGEVRVLFFFALAQVYVVNQDRNKDAELDGVNDSKFERHHL